MPEDLGAPQLPGSKSHAQRALLLASFRPGQTVLRGVPDNQDLQRLATVMVSRGVTIDSLGSDLVVRGIPPRPDETVVVFAGENGTAARMLLAESYLDRGDRTDARACLTEIESVDADYPGLRARRAAMAPPADDPQAPPPLFVRPAFPRPSE